MWHRALVTELALLSLCLIGWAVGVALSGNHQNGLAIGFGSFIVVASLPSWRRLPSQRLLRPARHPMDLPA